MAKKDIAPKNIMDMVLKESEKRFKGNIYTASDQMARMVGVEHYSIALQWLIHSNVIPLQSVITFAAAPKNYKTSAALEFLRLFISSGGHGLYVNTEGKLSPTKLSSILRESLTKLQLASAGTTEEWVETVSKQVVLIHETMEKIYAANFTTSKAEGLDEFKGGYLSPYMIVIDSLSGSQSESMVGRVQAGEVGKTFNDRAMIITQFLNAWSSLLVGLPLTVLLINHEKADMEGGRVTPGGVAPAFHTSLDIRSRRGKEDKYVRNNVPVTETTLSWYVNFSSIGKDHRSLEITYVDTYDEAGNQVCWFDWDSALVDLIMRLSKEMDFKHLVDVCTIEMHLCGNKGNHYTCPQIGIKTKQEALEAGVNKAKLGLMLQSSPEMRAVLQSALRIQMFNRWTPEFAFPKPNPLPDEYKPRPQFRK